MRKYILQPGSRDDSRLADWSTDQPAKVRRRGDKGKGPPSLDDLMRQRHSDSAPSQPSKRDALLSSAAVQVSREASREQKASAAAAAAPAAAGTAAAAAGAAGKATPAVAASQPSLQQAAAQPPPAAQGQAAAAQQPAAQQPAAAAQAATPPPPQQQQQRQQEGEAQAEAGGSGLDWCNTTLKPAVAAADSAAAAAAAAATPAERLAANHTLWMACLAQQEQETLCLMLPMPSGGEQRCVPLFQVGRSARLLASRL